MHSLTKRLAGPVVLIGALLTLQPEFPASAAEADFSDPSKVRALAEKFFRNARFTGPVISPDAKRLAVHFSQDGREMLVVRALPDGQPTPIVQLPDPEARLRWLRWVSEDRLLFSVEEPLRSGGPPPRPRRSRLYAIDADGSGHLHLARNWVKAILIGRGEFQWEDQVVDFLDSDPDHVLISIRKPTDSYPGVYRLDVSDGGLKPVVPRLDGVYQWYSDHEGQVRAGYGYEHEKYRLFARADAKKKFEPISEYEWAEDHVHFEGFSFEPQKIYVAKAGEDGVDSLYEYDLTTKTLGPEVFSYPKFNVPAWLEFSDERRVLAEVGYFAEGPERHFLDTEAARVQEILDKALPGTFNRITSESRDGSIAVVRSTSDTQAPRYHLFDRNKKTLAFLFSSLPALDYESLAPMQAVSYKARDGLTIPGYLTLPKDGPSQGLPAVVYPHGGPSARDIRGFDLVTQYLAALGFAVLQPNYRGSTGYGEDHLAAGLQEWGLAMQDDITDGVDWLVESGVADPARVCIYGASYGGYAALMGLVKTPEKFRCAAAYAAPTDLVMLLKHGRGYLFSDQNVPYIGSTSKDRQRLQETSPLQNVDRIRAPVLLAHGEDDDRVHVAHSTKLAKALKKAGKPVEITIIPDEAHSFRDEARRIEYYARLGSFLLENTKLDRR